MLINVANWIMRLPTLTKLPRPRRFEFPARYYDDIKEDAEERERRFLARKKLEQALKNGEDISQEEYAERITSSFRQNRSLKRPQEASTSVALVRLFLIVLLGGSFWLYLEYGHLLDEVGTYDVGSILGIFVVSVLLLYFFARRNI